MNVTVSQLTQNILASYQNVGGINHVDGVHLPSKIVIAAITEDLLCLLFPGFFRERPVSQAELPDRTAELVVSILQRLEEQILKSLAYHPATRVAKKELPLLARKLALGFLGRLPQIRELLHTDAEAAYHGDPAALSKEEVIVAYPFMEAIAVQRMAHELYRDEVALIPRLMTEWAHSRTGMDLHPGARIGSHFFIDHGTGTVIGETSTIGHHVKMYQGVGLVARSLAGGQQLRGQKRHPTIEDRVTLYAGATIVGGDTVIGAGSTIGGNVFLMHSVPPNSVVLYEAGEVQVLKKKPDSRLIIDYQI